MHARPSSRIVTFDHKVATAASYSGIETSSPPAYDAVLPASPLHKMRSTSVNRAPPRGVALCGSLRVAASGEQAAIEANVVLFDLLP